MNSGTWDKKYNYVNASNYESCLQYELDVTVPTNDGTVTLSVFTSPLD